MLAKLRSFLVLEGKTAGKKEFYEDVLPRENWGRSDATQPYRTPILAKSDDCTVPV